MAIEFKRSQREDAVGSLWAALAAKEDTQRRGMGTLQVEANSEGRRRRGEGEERGRSGGERGGEGAGVLSNEKTGRIHCQPA